MEIDESCWGDRVIFGNENGKLEITSVCRVCGVSSEGLMPIYEGQGLETEIGSKLKQHLPIQILENDSLPKEICYKCASTVVAWHKFTINCLIIHKKFQDLLRDVTLKINGGETSKVQDVSKEAVSNFNKNEGFSEVPVEKEEMSQRDSNISRFSLPYHSLTESLPKQNCIKCTANEEEESSHHMYEYNGGDTAKSRDSGNVHHDTRETIKHQTKIDSEYDCDHFNDKQPELLFDTNPPDKQGIGVTVPSCEGKHFTNSHNVCTGNVDHENSTDKQNHIFKTCNKLDILCNTCSEFLSQEEDCKRDSQNHFCMEPDHKDQVQNLEEGVLCINKLKVYPCEKCGKYFSSKDSCARHTRIHSGERPYTCHVCGKQFRDSGGLQRHLKDVHARIKKFGCDICGRFFASKVTRDDHRRIHTGERPYVCAACGKTFKSKAALYIHNKIHTNLYPYSCSYCEKGFRRRQELDNHLVTHTGEKPHICETCGKRFGVKGEMTRHQQTHTDNKPYVCSLCGLTFKMKRYLKNHERTHIRKL